VDGYLSGLSALLLLGILLSCHYLAFAKPARSRFARNLQRATKLRLLGVAGLSPIALELNLQQDFTLASLVANQILIYLLGSSCLEVAWLYQPRPGGRDWRNAARGLLLLLLLGQAALTRPNYRELVAALLATAIVARVGVKIHGKIFRDWKPQSLWLQSVQSRLASYALVLCLAASGFYLLRAWTVVPVTSGQIQGVREILVFIGLLAMVELGAGTLEHVLQRRHRSAEVAALATDGLRAIAYVVIALMTASRLFHRDLSSMALSSAFFSLGLGLALKPTMGNLVAGLVLRISRDFEIGDFIQVDDLYGKVTHIDWRSIGITTIENDLVALPHSRVARSRLINYSLPSPQHACYLDLKLSAQIPPGRVRRELLEIVEKIPEVAQFPESEVYLMDIRDGACHYRIRWWLEDIVDRPLFESTVLRQLTYGLMRKDLRPLLPLRLWQGLVPQANPQRPTGQDRIGIEGH